MIVNTELVQWLNDQTDINSHEIDFVDGFVFMLHKIKKHRHIRLLNQNQIHPRFWRTHDKTFGYQLMNKKSKHPIGHLYQFYLDVAYNEQFVESKGEFIQITSIGLTYLQLQRDQQLEVLFSYIW